MLQSKDEKCCIFWLSFILVLYNIGLIIGLVFLIRSGDLDGIIAIAIALGIFNIVFIPIYIIIIGIICFHTYLIQCFNSP